MNHSQSLPTSREELSQTLPESSTTQPLRQMEVLVEERPLTSVMVCFGIGLGLGLAIGTTIAASMQEAPKMRMAERMGHQFLDALNRVVPESVSSRFSS